MTTLRVRVMAAALLPLIGACKSMQPVPVAFIPETKPDVVYLSDSRGRVQGVVSPRLSGDTVIGTSLEGNKPVAVPLRQVERVSTIRLSRGRTAMLVGGFAALGAFMTYAVLTNAKGDGSGYCDYDNPPTMGGTTCGYSGERPDP